MTVADLTARAAEAQRELDEYSTGRTDAARQLEQSQAAFKDDPTTGNGKELVKAEDAHKLAVLAEQGATERLHEARAALASAEREQALANLAELDLSSNLSVFEQHITPHVERVVELRAAIAETQAQVAESQAQIDQLVSAFTSGRRAEVLDRARELGSEAVEYRFDRYAAARLEGRPTNSETAFIRQKPAAPPAPRNFGAELMNASARKAAEREAEQRKASELEDARLAKALERERELDAAALAKVATHN